MIGVIANLTMAQREGKPNREQLVIVQQPPKHRAPPVYNNNKDYILNLDDPSPIQVLACFAFFLPLVGLLGMCYLSMSHT